MRRAISVALGAVALLDTVIVIGLVGVLAAHLPITTGSRATAQTAVALETLTFFSLGWLLSTHGSSTLRSWSQRILGVDFGLALLTITFSTAASAVTLVQLSHAKTDQKGTILGTQNSSYVAGTSVALIATVLSQLAALLYHFILRREMDQSARRASDLERQRQMAQLSSSTIRAKAWSPESDAGRVMGSTESRSPPPSTGRTSRSGTITSIKSTWSNVLSPVTSRTALMPKISKNSLRPSSRASSSRPLSAEDTFDTWDTSSVNTQNRTAVMEMTAASQLKGRFLEPIPGSPTIGRTPSPSDIDMPLEPPRVRPRSRSFSPVASRRRENPDLVSPPSMDELHIHPLFRSDSPTPPPNATPGTIVVASPNAGQIISDRHSIRSMSQKRVSSAPGTLSRRGSMESKKNPRDQQSIAEEPDEGDRSLAPSERSSTPPIPDWIMSAGARSSWTDYNCRRSRTASEV